MAALSRLEASSRRRAAAWLAVGLALGLLPLLALNASRGFEPLRQVFFASGPYAGPLPANQAPDVAAFVLGPAWPLLTLGLACGAWRAARGGIGLTLGRVALAHGLLHAAAFWLSGWRYLPGIAPTRVLFPLHATLAIVLACALDAPRARARARRLVAAGAIAAWLASVALPVATWLHSRAPRESGSWRSSWALVDGAALYERLVDEGVETVYAGRWTATSLVFAVRAARHARPESPPLAVVSALPRRPRPARGQAALVLHSDSDLLRSVEAQLARIGLVPERREWRGLVILSGLDSRRLVRGDLPEELGGGDWPAPPDEPDGFN